MKANVLRYVYCFEYFKKGDENMYVWPWLLSKAPLGPQHINRCILKHIAKNRIPSIKYFVLESEHQCGMIKVIYFTLYGIQFGKSLNKKKTIGIWATINVAVNWFEFSQIEPSSAFQKTAWYHYNGGFWICI